MAMILTEKEFHANLLEGAKALSSVVKHNYGPTGRTTIAEQQYDLPLVANTGRKILKDFSLKDRAQNLGAVLLRDAALKVGEDCGDGTIATVVLTDAMIRGGEKAIASGANPIILRNGMNKAVDVAVKAIREQSIECDPSRLAKLSASIAKFEDVGKTVFDAINAVGVDGTITVEDSQGSKTELHIWTGIKYDNGLLSDAMITDPVKKSVTFEDAFILLVNYKLDDIHEIMPVLNQSIQYGVPLVILAMDFSNELLTQLAANVSKGVIRLAAANPPGHGDTRRRNMLALASKTGALLFEENNGHELRRCGLEKCGRIDRITITKNSTVMQGFPLEDKEAVAILKRFTDDLVSQTRDPDELYKLEITQTILSGKIAEIIAGGTTEYEMFERKYLAENTVRALRSAISDGVVPGGGYAYLKAIPALKALRASSEDEQTGINIVCEAMTAPMTQLTENVGFPGSAAVEKAVESDSPLCFNTVTFQMTDPVSEDILDPTATVEKILRTAISTAGTILSSTAAVIAKKEIDI